MDGWMDGNFLGVRSKQIVSAWVISYMSIIENAKKEQHGHLRLFLENKGCLLWTLQLNSRWFGAENERL